MAVGPPPLSCDIVVGTRPEAIKLAPVFKALRGEPGGFAVRVVTSGRHGEICRTALAAFGLSPGCALDAETIGSSLSDSASELVRAFARNIAQSHPDLLLVQGDTTTALGAALAGFYARVAVAHVEAGLCSGDLANPSNVGTADSAILLSPSGVSDKFLPAMDRIMVNTTVAARCS